MKFNLQARFLHWASALVILWASISGFLLLLPNISEATRHGIGQFNVAVTTLFIPFFIWRMINRYINGVPEYPDSIKKNQATAAVAVHQLIYVLVSLVLISGVLMMESNISIFGLAELPQPISNESMLSLFKSIHEISTRLLALAIILHVAALVKHELVGNQILRRMI